MGELGMPAGIQTTGLIGENYFGTTKDLIFIHPPNTEREHGRRQEKESVDRGYSRSGGSRRGKAHKDAICS